MTLRLLIISLSRFLFLRSIKKFDLHNLIEAIEFKDESAEIFSWLEDDFFYQDFLSRTLTIHRTAGEGRGPSLFHCTTSTRSRTFRHLVATLHVRWLSHIFNHTACIYQAATRWDLPPYRYTTLLMDDVTLSFCLFTWWFDSSYFVTAIWDGKQVVSNSHRLSPL